MTVNLIAFIGTPINALLIGYANDAYDGLEAELNIDVAVGSIYQVAAFGSTGTSGSGFGSTGGVSGSSSPPPDAALTVIAQVSVNEPFTVVTVIVQLPALTAVTKPFTTVQQPFDVLHLTLVSDASDGTTV